MPTLIYARERPKGWRRRIGVALLIAAVALLGRAAWTLPSWAPRWSRAYHEWRRDVNLAALAGGVDLPPVVQRTVADGTVTTAHEPPELGQYVKHRDHLWEFGATSDPWLPDLSPAARFGRADAGVVLLDRPADHRTSLRVISASGDALLYSSLHVPTFARGGAGDAMDLVDHVVLDVVRPEGSTLAWHPASAEGNVLTLPFTLDGRRETLRIDLGRRRDHRAPDDLNDTTFGHFTTDGSGGVDGLHLVPPPAATDAGPILRRQATDAEAVRRQRTITAGKRIDFGDGMSVRMGQGEVYDFALFARPSTGAEERLIAEWSEPRQVPLAVSNNGLVSCFTWDGLTTIDVADMGTRFPTTVINDRFTFSDMPTVFAHLGPRRRVIVREGWLRYDVSGGGEDGWVVDLAGGHAVTPLWVGASADGRAAEVLLRYPDQFGRIEHVTVPLPG